MKKNEKKFMRIKIRANPEYFLQNTNIQTGKNPSKSGDFNYIFQLDFAIKNYRNYI